MAIMAYSWIIAFRLLSCRERLISRQLDAGGSNRKIHISKIKMMGFCDVKIGF
jgi:hypothetical protein